MSPFEQRSVMALNHRDGRPHDAGELEGRHLGSESVRGEGRAEVVDPRRSRDPGRLNCRGPLPTSEVVEPEEPTAGTGEEVARYPGRELPEGGVESSAPPTTTKARARGPASALFVNRRLQTTTRMLASQERD